MPKCSWLAPAIVAGVLSASAPALATPRPLPFTYTYETLPEGSAEIEQYVDLVPLKAIDATAKTPRNVWTLASQFQTEVEYGITDRLEFAVYAAIAPQADPNLPERASLTEGTGLKERLRYRIADEGVLPIDIALYGEVVEYETEFELEAKIILQKRFGDLRIAANLWAEREYYYARPQQDWILNPTLGVTYEVSPLFSVGVDSWLRVEYPSTNPHPRPFTLGPHGYVGPAFMFDFGKIWWTTAVYARVTDVDHSMVPGESFGPIWVRSVVGIGF